jgi:hypothetical protein
MDKSMSSYNSLSSLWFFTTKPYSLFMATKNRGFSFEIHERYFKKLNLKKPKSRTTFSKTDFSKIGCLKKIKNSKNLKFSFKIETQLLK